MMGFELILIVAIVGAIAYGLGWRPQLGQSGPSQPSQTPVEILKARYTRGEITREEYEQARSTIEG